MITRTKNLLRKQGKTIEIETDINRTDGPAILTETGPEIPDKELIPLVKNGVRWAADRLVRRHYEKARKMAYHLCDGNLSEAQDMTQEAFLNAFGHIGTFEEKASFKTWFYRILINTCRDAKRRRHRWFGLFGSPRLKKETGETEAMGPESFPDESESNDPAGFAGQNELREDIQYALQKLPKQQQLVFKLKVLDELSIPEIAETLAMSPGTVKSHLFRATRHMREALAEWAER